MSIENRGRGGRPESLEEAKALTSAELRDALEGSDLAVDVSGGIEHHPDALAEIVDLDSARSRALNTLPSMNEDVNGVIAEIPDKEKKSGFGDILKGAGVFSGVVVADKSADLVIKKPQHKLSSMFHWVEMYGKKMIEKNAGWMKYIPFIGKFAVAEPAKPLKETDAQMDKIIDGRAKKTQASIDKDKKKAA
jgi:hypothetical protein